MSFQVDLKIIETVREQNGLALSSRNIRLTPESKAIAPVLYQSLLAISEGLVNGCFEEAKTKSLSLMAVSKQIVVEYIEVVEMKSGKIVTTFTKGNKYGICIAAFVGNIRLIDNVVVDYK